MATDAVTHDPSPVLPLELSPTVDHLVTEDDTPVDNIFSEKQQRMLTESLLNSWPGPGGGGPFVVMANVGLFYATRTPAVVPDALLSINVALPVNVWPKSARSYFRSEYGKAPDVVIEIVSNHEGGEDSNKLVTYARIGVPYYTIYDPEQLLSDERLRAYQLKASSYERMEPIWFPEVGLGLQTWAGRFEDLDATWLRWFDASGTLIPTGKENTETERQRAETERQRAEAERQRADEERQRADIEHQCVVAERQRAEAAVARSDRLTELLRQHGIQPEGE